MTGTPPPVPPGGRLGPYRLLHQVGEGGMGVVHLALDPSGRAVALKVLRPHVAGDPSARDRLRREVDVLRRVRHRRVAEVLDADPDGPVPYVVTQFVPGRSLEQHVEEEGPMAPAALARLADGLGQALAAVHDAGVVHRDLKPANVLMLDGDPVVIDFGIAKVADDVRLTRADVVMGTPGYLSPELVAGAEVGPAADWWGWAATTVFAATGRPPFGRGPLEVVLDRVRRGDPDLDGVPAQLVPVLSAALSPDARERPSEGWLRRAVEDLAASAGAVAPSAGDAAATSALARLAGGRLDAEMTSAVGLRAGPRPPRDPDAPYDWDADDDPDGPHDLVDPATVGDRRPGTAPVVADDVATTAVPRGEVPTSVVPRRASSPDGWDEDDARSEEVAAGPGEEDLDGVGPDDLDDAADAADAADDADDTADVVDGRARVPSSREVGTTAVPRDETPTSAVPVVAPSPPTTAIDVLATSAMPRVPAPPAAVDAPAGAAWTTSTPAAGTAAAADGPGTRWAEPAAAPPRGPDGGAWTTHDASPGPVVDDHLQRQHAEVPSPLSSPWPPAAGHGAHPSAPPLLPVRRPDRPGLRVAVAAALVATTALVPVVGVLVALGLVLLSRTVERADRWVARRREGGLGPRRGDVPWAVVRSPLTLLAAAVPTVLSLVLPLVAAVAAAFLAGTVLADAGVVVGDPVSLAAGAAVGAVTTWWGPGGRRLRRGAVLVSRAAPRGVGGRVVVLLALLVVVAAVWLAVTGTMPDWRPLTAPRLL